MPQLIVVTDLPESGGKVVYRERIVSSDFESSHFTDQLAERLGWAVHDADDLAEEETTALDEVAPPGLTVMAC